MGESERRRRVLVVEDDDGNRLLVRRALEAQGLGVAEAIDGPTALHCLERDGADLVVLDLGLPGLDGLSVLGHLRRASAVPVLVLTGHTGADRRIAGLEAGADDYLEKPYELAELVARVRALLRRCDPAVRASARRLQAGLVTIDLDENTVSIGDRAIAMTPKEFGLLAYLARNAPRALARDAVLGAVWGSASEWQDPATVTEHIRRIRAKLFAAGAGEVIETVRGVGYRIAAPPAEVGA